MNQDIAAPIALAAFGFVCAFLIAVIVAVIFYYLTLQKALSRCAPRNRTMEPAMVWLNLVPLLNIYWTFHTVISVSNSLRNEFIDRDIDDGSDYAKMIGLIGAIFNLLGGFISIAFSIADYQPGVYASYVFTFISLVLTIVYWVRVAAYSRELAQDDFRDDRFDDDRNDRNDDDRPRRPLRGPASTDITSKDKDDRYS